LVGCLSLVAGAAGARVAPLTPEGEVMMEKRKTLEAHARTSLGDHGLIEKLRDWRKYWGFIIVGKEGSRLAPRVLVKDEYGWFEMRPGQTRRLPREIGHELNRLLTSATIREEQPYHWGKPCRETPRLFVVAHAGNDQFGRLGCGPEGIAARAARIAETLRLPSRRGAEILPARIDRPVAGIPFEQHRDNTDIFARLQEKIYAWDRKTLAGFVDPYAEDVVLEGPFGTLRGRKAAVDWARSLQDWTGPYPGRSPQLVLNQSSMTNQPSRSVRFTTHEVRWEEQGKPVRQTFSTLWRNNGGLWQIAHERMSEVKPVLDGVRY
jgi:hypothetical protein